MTIHQEAEDQEQQRRREAEQFAAKILAAREANPDRPASSPPDYRRWRKFSSFAVRFAELCFNLGKDGTEGRETVFDNMVEEPVLSNERFAAIFYTSVDWFDGYARQRVYNSRIAYQSVAARLKPCAELILPGNSENIEFLREAVSRNPHMDMKEFAERLHEFSKGN